MPAVVKVMPAVQACRVIQAQMVLLAKVEKMADQVNLAEEGRQVYRVPEGLQEIQVYKDFQGARVHRALLVLLVQLGKEVLLVCLDLRDRLALQGGQELKEALDPEDRRVSQVILEKRGL